MGQSAKRAGLFILFGTILVIPRIRHLRRRVWAWTLVRLAAAACGGWLVWRFARGQVGWPGLCFAGLIIVSSLLVRSRPLTKSVDDLAQELNALVVLNGGAFRPARSARSISSTRIYVRSDALLVSGPREQRLAEIPLGSIRNLMVYAVKNGAGEDAEPWEVGIEWGADQPASATFRYEGAFAEHLARVTELTVRSQWKKELPVIG